jgi:hypothetical protein
MIQIPAVTFLLPGICTAQHNPSTFVLWSWYNGEVNEGNLFRELH